MRHPKVSIILTNYNKSQFLKKSIESVLNQTYKNFELIIIDDASTDGSEKIIKNYIHLKNIKYFKRNKNSRTAAIPRNEGVKKSNCEYLCFLDADDYWKENKLFEQIKNLKKSTFLSFTSCDYVDKNNNKINSIISWVREKLQKRYYDKGLPGMYIYNSIVFSSVLIKRNVFKKFYFDESLDVVGNEDYDLWLKFFNVHRRNVGYISKRLVSIRKLDISLNRNYFYATIRSFHVSLKFFLKQKKFINVHQFLFGLFLRINKLIYKTTFPIIKRYFIYTILILFLSYTTIFKSTLFWKIGNNLLAYDEKYLTNNLLILSGNGDFEYKNTSYQMRYLDIRKIEESKKFNKIFILGRQQEIDESLILKSLLLLDGFDESKIITLNEQYRNTKENINYIENILKDNSIKKINLISSPYHTKRYRLLWNKNTNDIDLIILENQNNPLKQKDKILNSKKIKLILYEYLAIFYNRLRGWI